MIAIPLDSHFCITFTDAKDNNPGFNSFYVSDFRMSVMFSFPFLPNMIEQHDSNDLISVENIC